MKVTTTLKAKKINGRIIYGWQNYCVRGNSVNPKNIVVKIKSDNDKDLVSITLAGISLSVNRWDLDDAIKGAGSADGE